MPTPAPALHDPGWRRDGVPIDVSGYRVSSPVFSITVPEDNLCTGFDGTGAGTVRPVVADGYYLMVPPLADGEHTIFFAGSLLDGAFALDVTYHLEVG